MEKSIICILFFIVGTVFGSFYNVVALRISKKESIIKPRSHCENCKRNLSWYEMIPLFSYIFLKGRCRACHTIIGFQSFLSELITGILFTVSFYSFSFSYDLLIALFLSSLFVIVMITDLTYYIIPDSINLVFGIIIVIIDIFKYKLDAIYYLTYGIIVFLFMYVLMLIGNKLFKEESIGGGDIKLLFVLAMTMPLLLSILSIATGCIIALPISMYLYLKRNDKILPFGPFLVAGFLIVFMFKIDANDVLKYLIIK